MTTTRRSVLQLLGASLAAAKLGAAQSPSPIVSMPVPPIGLSLPPARTPDFIASGLWWGDDDDTDARVYADEEAMWRDINAAEDARFNRRTTL